MRGRLSSEAVQILCRRAPAHPLRRRLRSIWPISDLSADDSGVHPATHPLSPRPRESFPLSAGSVRSVDRRDVIRSTIYSGITGSLRCRHSAGIQETPPFNYATSSDGAVVGVRCGVVLMVVTSTGLRSTGGSLSQGFRSVRSCSALLFGDRGARYGVTVWSGVRCPDQLLASCPRTRGLRGCGLRPESTS